MALIDELQNLNQTSENIQFTIQRIDSRHAFASEKGLRLLQQIADTLSGQRPTTNRPTDTPAPGRPTPSARPGTQSRPTSNVPQSQGGLLQYILTQLVSSIGLRGPLSLFLRPGSAPGGIQRLNRFFNPTREYTQQEATQAIARRASENDIRRRVMADGTVRYDELGTRPGTRRGQFIDVSRLSKQQAFEAEEQSRVGTRVVRPLAKAFRMFIGVIGATVVAVNLVNEALSKFQKELGGVSRSQAAKEFFGSLMASFKSFFTGTFVGAGQIRQTQGAFAQEYGGLLTSGDAAQFAQVVKRAGLDTQSLVGLQRALQGTGRDVEDTINTFLRSGVTSQVAAAEIQKNAGAVARAGNKFNEYIVEGIKNAKRLGLEFSQIEQTLAGYGMNFEGTVEGFAQLRSIIPGMAVDFGELLYTSVYGSTDDFIGQIRDSLNSAGITSASQLNRLQGQMLQQQTGFDEAQLDRILKGQEAGPSFQEGLDMTRNSLLKNILLAMVTLTGAVIIGSKFGVIGALVGAGGAYALGQAFLPDAQVGDAVITPQGQVIETSPEDYLFATKTPETLVSQTSVDTKNLENQMMANTQALQEIKEMFRSGLSMNISGMEEATMQGLDYAYNRQLRS